jgi:rubredoxin
MMRAILDRIEDGKQSCSGSVEAPNLSRLALHPTPTAWHNNCLFSCLGSRWLLSERLMSEAESGTEYRTWMCVVCGLMYDEALGWPDDGLAPGTRWEDIPETWTCPDCGAAKDDFEMIEV